MIAKLVNNQLIAYNGTWFNFNGQNVSNADSQVLLNAGYKPVVMATVGENERIVSFHYAESPTQITQVVDEIETIPEPEEPVIEEPVIEEPVAE